MTGHLTDIVVPDALIGTFHAEGELRINVYRTGDSVRIEAISLTEALQTNFTLAPSAALEIADLIKEAAQPRKSQ